MTQATGTQVSKRDENKLHKKHDILQVNACVKDQLSTEQRRHKINPLGRLPITKFMSKLAKGPSTNRSKTITKSMSILDKGHSTNRLADKMTKLDL